MRIEKPNIPAPAKSKINQRFRNFESDIDGLKRKLKSLSDDRKALFGSRYTDSPTTDDQLEQRQQLLSGTDRLERSSGRLRESQRIALETEDQISLAPYLRGIANAALGQMPAAIIDFQTVLDHRGSALTLGNSAFPMAAISLARAHAVNRDKRDSVLAYQRFLALWREADQSQPLTVEALAKSK